MRHIAVVKDNIVDDALAWAKLNCSGYITNDYHMCGYELYDINSYDFFFATQKDAMWFALKWS